MTADLVFLTIACGFVFLFGSVVVALLGRALLRS
jgi:hypothetical protein